MTTPNALLRTNPESRIREIRPSGLMRGGVRSLKTDIYGRFNFEDLALPTLLRDSIGSAAHGEKDVGPEGLIGGLDGQHVIR